MQPDQDIMDKVTAIRDKTGEYTSYDLCFTAFMAGENELEYHFCIARGKNLKHFTFKTREALVAHLDGILDNLRPKEETTR